MCGMLQIEVKIMEWFALDRMLTDSNATVVPKNMELWFSKKISQLTLTCHEIKGEGNTCIEVVLIDSSTGKKIEAGPVAFANVELVVLAQGTDDCIGEEFNEKIVRVEGNRLPLLTANLCKLQGGSCVLEDVKFRHHATQVMKPTVFWLGARIVGIFNGINVKEAKTESFAVKCFRKKYSMKNEIPNLRDKIWVLKKVRRGKIEERLQAEGIDTVEKFLIHLLRNPQELKQIDRSKGKTWESTVNHARKCQSYKMYWYFNSQENSGVVFDIFGELQWTYSEGQYAATNRLSEDKKVDADKLLSSAFEHWGDVTLFDDPDSLQQHLEDVKTSFNLSNSRIPGQYPDTGASEMVDGSNMNIEVPDPLLNQGISVSEMNSLPLSESFGIHDFTFIDDFYSPLDHLVSRYWIEQ